MPFCNTTGPPMDQKLINWNSLTEKDLIPIQYFFKIYEQMQFLEQKAMEIFNESFWIKILKQDKKASICKTTKTWHYWTRQLQELPQNRLLNSSTAYPKSIYFD